VAQVVVIKTHIHDAGVGALLHQILDQLRVLELVCIVQRGVEWPLELVRVDIHVTVVYQMRYLVHVATLARKH
jgi:hypothetical protein